MLCTEQRLHTAVGVEASDCKWLAQLCRCIARPALPDEWILCNAAVQMEIKPNTPWRDGPMHQVISSLTFM